MFKNLILPASLLAATIIGAGVFALPYVFDKAGMLTGLFYLIGFGLVFIVIHLMYTDVIVRTDSLHLLAGYAKIYLGETGKWLTALITITGMIFILTAYLILAINFMGLVLPNLPSVCRLFIFWVLASIPIFWGVRRLATSEFLIALGTILIIFLIFFYGLNFSWKILSVPAINLSYFFLPYGAVLFSLSGSVAVPALVHYFNKNQGTTRKIKKAIVLGTIIPAMLYLIFIIGIINISPKVSADSISGLTGQLPLWLMWLLGILGTIAILSPYATIGRDVRKSLEADFNFRIGWWPGIIVAILPLFIYFLGLKDFSRIISLAGGILIGLESLFIVLIWQRARKINPQRALIGKIPKMIPYLLLLVFIVGIMLEIRK